MNEQERADALAEQLDTLLAGDSLPEMASGELGELLQLADQLTEAIPASRPEFGPALKESLLKSVDEGGTNTTGGIAIAGSMLAIVIGGIVVLLIMLGLVVGGLLQNQVTPTPGNNPALIGAPDENAPVNTSTTTITPTATITPTTPMTPTTGVTVTVPITSSPIIDIITIIIGFNDYFDDDGIEIDLNIDFGLVPGYDSGSSHDDDDDDGGGSGDHDRGHGNDADGHDEDNPGNSRHDDNDDDD